MIFLKEVDIKITELDSLELGYDDMNEENSAYIQESILMRRFVKVG